MNALADNAYTQTWSALGQAFSPKAILMVSAHWYIPKLAIQSEEKPRKINDMYGFPDELYRLAYPAPGDIDLTRRVRGRIGQDVEIDDTWGIDHGAWSVLVHMYPGADTPVVQLSVDQRKRPSELYAIGQKLKDLRDRGVMIIGSGNIVHNLRRAKAEEDAVYPWAEEFDQAIHDAILAGGHEICIDYHRLVNTAPLAVPTSDHYDPLLYVLGASFEEDEIAVHNKRCTNGSLSMTSYVFHSRGD